MFIMTVSNIRAELVSEAYFGDRKSTEVLNPIRNDAGVLQVKAATAAKITDEEPKAPLFNYERYSA